MRVLQVLGSSAGGVARHVAQVTSALGSLGEPGEPGEAADTVHVAGPAELAAVVAPSDGAAVFHTTPIADRPRLSDIQAVLRLRALSAGADVVHAHGLRAGALAVLAVRTLPSRARPRMVVTLHNLPVGGRAIRTVSAVLERIVARGADVVLGVSGDLVVLAKARGARQASRALVPAPPLPQPSRDRAAVRGELGLAEHGTLVVSVARLAPQKGLGLLADAAALLHGRSGHGVLWALAGDGPLRGELQARIDAEGLPVRLLGRREDVADLMAAADVVASTAVWEGQPIAVQEALQLGCPLVATDAGGTREVTGDAAVLVPVGDADAFARALSEVLADPSRREALAASSRAQAATLPRVADVVAQLRAVYSGRAASGE
ncbi:glycosyltransferase family 4 protein [Cellulomonas cellasea]|uniref:glycosyltransferase family 4 protein n=1 Tax=Cellulomonas cellasea TaxID=43670 RepID=UPI0025A40318|nr:glycosyltransferase family 4 protein [Cellulomonas cellasea]MDM8085964.1 glycosyltransferase family 4 protein [Cellulomonas cellasea]